MDNQNIEQLVAELKQATTHRAKAEIENKICNILGIVNSRDAGRSKLKVLGISYDALEKRQTILKAGSESAWDLLDNKHHSLTQVYKLTTASLKNKKIKNIDKTIEKQYNKLSEDKSIHTQNNNGKVSFVKNPATQKEKVDDCWEDLKKLIMRIVSIECKDLNQIEQVRLKTDLEDEMKGFIYQSKARVNATKKHGISSKSSLASVDYKKRKFLKALNDTGFDPPSRGKPITKKYIKKVRDACRRKLGVAHPDKHLNNIEMANISFKELNNNVMIIEEYFSSLETT